MSDGKTIRNLKNAPIREAIIDFRCSNKGSPDAKKLNNSYYEKIKVQYPSKQFIKVVQGTIQVSPESGMKFSSSPQVPDVIQCFNKENTLAVRAGIEGFGFSRLKPYLDWENILEHAKNLYSQYIEEYKPDKITRTAVRYINDIPLPSNFDLKEYFRTTPEISPDLPQGLLHYVMKLTIPIGSSFLANITQVLEPMGSAGTKLTFDLDVFTLKPFPADGNEHWDALEELRNYKNEIFFGSLTEKAMRAFD